MQVPIEVKFGCGRPRDLPQSSGVVDMVLALGSQTDARSVVEPEPPLLRLPLRDLQPLPPRDALDPFQVHRPTGPHAGGQCSGGIRSAQPRVSCPSRIFWHSSDMDPCPPPLLNRFMAIASFAIVAIAGLAGATVPFLRPQSDAPAVAVFIPPFDGGRTMREIVQSGFAIVDLRLDGHLVVLQTTGGPDPAALSAAGLITFAFRPPTICIERRPQS